MKYIKTQIMTNAFGEKIKSDSDLQISIKHTNFRDVIYINSEQIIYITELKTLKDSDCIIGEYFIIHCSDNTNYYLDEYEYQKFV